MTANVVQYSLITLLFFCLAEVSAAGKPDQHITGNPRIDFFGLADPTRMTAEPHAMSILQETDVEAREKSPWLAGFISLAVPGAGELYTENYVKAGIFFAIEAASWFVAYSYDKKGDDQTKAFEAYANRHWSAVRYADWSIDHRGALNPTIPATDYEALVFPDGRVEPGDPEDRPPFDVISWVGLSTLERDISAYGNTGYTHVLPSYGEQQYYELIGKYEQFSRGWDDANYNDPPDPNDPSSNRIRSNSRRFYEYAEMRAEANNQYDIASTFVSIAVLNHIVSAVDAFWSATRYNKSLHASVGVRMQRTQIGMVPVRELKMKYEF